jgi:hypothetical protein
MHNADEILFSNEGLKKPKKSVDALFNTNIDWDNDVASIDVSYFSLKEDKVVGKDIVVTTNEKLIGVGVCEKTGLVNVCYFDENNQRYFWVKPDEINTVKTVVEYWKLNDIKIHIKAIKEKWNTQTEKNIKKEPKKQKNKTKKTEIKEKVKKNLKN